MGFVRDTDTPTVVHLAHDRTDHRRDVYVDPAAHKLGVFAVLEDHELSEAERKRAAEAEAAAETRGKRPSRLWLPADVLRRVTNLYKKLTPSSPSSGGSGASSQNNLTKPKDRT